MSEPIEQTVIFDLVLHKYRTCVSKCPDNLGPENRQTSVQDCCPRPVRASTYSRESLGVPTGVSEAKMDSEVG